MTFHNTLRLAAVALGLVVGLAAAEGVARRMDPPPRVNAVLPSERLAIRDHQGALYWEHAAPERRNLACVEQHPERRRLALFGSSILYGSGVEAHQALSAGLQQALPGWCVANYAEPAYGFEAKRAAAAAALPTLAPDLVLWEVWINDGARYDRLGDAAFDWGDLVRDETGTPTWLPLPGPLHRALFRHSRAYAWATIARAPGGYAQGPRIWSALLEGGLEDLKAAIEDRGGALILTLWPRLDRPFAESAAAPPSSYDQVRGWAEAAGVEVIDVAALLRDQDPEALRLDPCCHYNPAGHALLAERLAERLAPRLAEDPGDPE